jgi:N-acetylglucosaminyl-diphospho-decaprenol L-rhamnosyltransferase
MVTHAARRPQLAVIIVTYNSAEVLPGALQSLAPADVDLRAVVVADNASVDDSVKIAESADHLPIRIVQTGRNAGYAAAINAATTVLDLDDLDAVFVMNPDCRLRPDALSLLAIDLQRPRCGIAVPRLLNLDGTLQPSLRWSPTIRRAITEAMIGGKIAGRIGRLGELITNPRAYEKAVAVVWATGAAMLISTQLIKEIGPWDESFFLFSEETEYCLRAADHGYHVWYNPQATSLHIGGDAAANPDLTRLTVVNKVRLYRMRHNALLSSIFFAATLAGEAARALTGRRTARAAVDGLIRGARSGYAVDRVLGQQVTVVEP